MAYRAAVCDDSAADADYVRGIVAHWAEQRGIALECRAFSSAEQFLFCYAEDKNFDLLLLDVEMPGADGVTLAKMVRQENEAVQIVFITGYSDYIAEGYDVAALHYLMKPVRPEKLCAVLDRAWEKHRRNERCLNLERSGEMIRLPLYEVRYLDVHQNYVTVHARQDYTLKRTLAEFEAELDEQFFRVGRGMILNLKQIRRVTKKEVVLASRRINEWGYRHREEEAGYVKRLAYVQKVATDRQYGKDIRIFGLREWVEELWESTMRLYHGFLLRRETAYLWANVIDLALLLVRNGAAYAYLIWLTLEQGLPVSQFLLYFGAATGFAQWVSGILEKFAKLHKQCLDISTVREFLEYPEPFRFEDGLPLEKRLDTPYELRLEGVSYRYPGAEKDTIHKLDLTVRPGENLAIVGLNGAGKTTLVKLLCGFLDPTEGRVLLNGQDIRPYNRRDYYKLFAAVFQDFSVLSATVAENVAQCRTGIDEARVWHCLDEAGLTEKVQSLPKQLETQIGREVYEDGIELSGGQTQRLMLARALYKDAPVLVLDEPTAALDPIAENDIYQKYNEMTAGKTSLFISHRLASTRFCDRILYLKDGRVAEEGTHEELLKRGGGYADLFEVQSQYYREENEA